MLTTLRLKSNVLSFKSGPRDARLIGRFRPKTACRQYSPFPRQQSFVPFFTKSKISNPCLGRRLFWALPIAGGLLLCFAPRKPLLLSSVISSPKLIPVQSTSPEHTFRGQLIINSPDEEDRSLISRIRRLLSDWFIEPILTASRFVHLFIIFVPVILTSPALLLGEVRRSGGRERSGAIWWYDYLVSALGRAGPTFIKVCRLAYNPFPFLHLILV